jgi:hypothetical protein
MNITTKHNWRQILDGWSAQSPLNGMPIWLQAVGLATVISFLITALITIVSVSIIAYAQAMELVYSVHINLAPYSNWQESAITYGVYAGIAFAAAALSLKLRAKSFSSKLLNFHPMPAPATEALLFFGVAQGQKNTAANEAFEGYSGTVDKMPSALNILPYSKC